MNCEYDKVPDDMTLCPIAIASKSVSITEQQFSNIERETLDIVDWLEKFHH